MLILAVTDQFSPFCSYNYQNISQKMVAGCMECQQYNEERLQCTIKVIIKRQTARRKLHALAGDVVAKYSSCVRELCLYKCVCVCGGGVFVYAWAFPVEGYGQNLWLCECYYFSLHRSAAQWSYLRWVAGNLYSIVELSNVQNTK